MRRVEDIDADIAAAEERVAKSRARLVERLANAAEEAGFLDIEIDDKTMLRLFSAIVAEVSDPPLNIYARRKQRLNLLKLKRATAAKRDRKRDDRAKFILGGYLLAQFKRNPEMAAEYTPLITAYVEQQRTASLRAQDLALVSAQIERHIGAPGPITPMPLNKVNRATIIIGAWLIDAMKSDPALNAAHRAGIIGFIDAGDTAKGREADRAVVSKALPQVRASDDV